MHPIYAFSPADCLTACRKSSHGRICIKKCAPGFHLGNVGDGDPAAVKLWAGRLIQPMFEQKLRAVAAN